MALHSPLQTDGGLYGKPVRTHGGRAVCVCVCVCVCVSLICPVTSTHTLNTGTLRVSQVLQLATSEPNRPLPEHERTDGPLSAACPVATAQSIYRPSGTTVFY